MSADLPDDDPTHALDDFVRRMRPGAAVAKPKGGTLRSGQIWAADDVVDVADIVLPTVVTPATINPAALDDSLRQASQSVHAQWRAEQQAHAQPVWQPDARALAPLALRRSADPRLLSAWQPGAWTTATYQVTDAATEIATGPQGSTTVETYAPQRLLLLWPPQRLDAPLLGRWPQQAWLCALPPDDAAGALLAGLPADARLWHNPHAGDVDWVLAAEIVLHHQADLRPFQASGLRAFINREREANFSRLNADYQQPAAAGPVQRR